MLLAALPARKNRHLNPFQYLLYEALKGEGWEAVEFESGLRRLPSIRLVHLHWPDGAVLQPSLVRSIPRFFAFFGLLALYKLLRVPVVWTAHNTRSHDGHHPRLESLLWALLYPCLDAILTLKPVEEQPELTRHPSLRGTPIVHIPHGEFASYYRAEAPSDRPTVRPSDGTASPPFLVFGHIRPYKKVPDILRSFRAHPDPQARLVIAGRSLEPALTTEIEALVAADTRVTFRNELIPDEEVAPLFDAARALVLASDPAKNSGILHLAASFGLPVVTFQDGHAAWDDPESLTPPPAWSELAAAHARLFWHLLT